MFKVSHVFSEVIGNWNGKGVPVEIGREVPAFDELSSGARRRCRDLGLEVQQWHGSGSRYLELGDGTRLDRHSVYGLCDLAGVLEAIEALIVHICLREGPGLVWFVAPPSYLRRRAEDDDGHIATRIEGIETEHDGHPTFTPTGNGTRRVLIGAYYFHAPAVKHPDPLDVEYDGWTLRDLLRDEEKIRRHEAGRHRYGGLTPAQRAAISAHWSAQLRTKIAASAAADVQRERGRVACDPRDPLDLE